MAPVVWGPHWRWVEAIVINLAPLRASTRYWRAQGARNPSPVSSWPAMAMLLAPISFSEVLPMHSLHIHGSIGCYGNRLRELYLCLALCGCVDIGDISWYHFLPGGGIHISLHRCARRKLTWKDLAYNRWSEHQVSKQMRDAMDWCCEDITKLKREQRRILKLSLVAFFLCFIVFSLFCEISHLMLESKNSYNFWPSISTSWIQRVVNSLLKNKKYEWHAWRALSGIPVLIE